MNYFFLYLKKYVYSVNTMIILQIITQTIEII